MRVHPETPAEERRLFRVALTASLSAWLLGAVALAAAQWYVGDLRFSNWPEFAGGLVCLALFFVPFPLLYYPWRRQGRREGGAGPGAPIDQQRG
jgi:hypothetical protein